MADIATLFLDRSAAVGARAQVACLVPQSLFEEGIRRIGASQCQREQEPGGLAGLADDVARNLRESLHHLPQQVLAVRDVVHEGDEERLSGHLDVLAAKLHRDLACVFRPQGIVDGVGLARKTPGVGFLHEREVGFDMDEGGGFSDQFLAGVSEERTGAVVDVDEDTVAVADEDSSAETVEERAAACDLGLQAPDGRIQLFLRGFAHGPSLGSMRRV